MQVAVIGRCRQVKLPIHFYHCWLNMVRKEPLLKIEPIWLERDFLVVNKVIKTHSFLNMSLTAIFVIAFFFPLATHHWS